MTTRKFFSLLTIFALLFLAVMGGGGCGGGSSTDPSGDAPDNTVPAPDPAPTPAPTPTPAPEPIPDPDSERTTFTVTFDSDGGTKIDAQVVAAGGIAARPDEPTKEYHVFMGWYPEIGFSFLYDFQTPITKDMTLYAKWYDTEDTTDSDGDGLPDELEITFGTDPYSTDTDSDGLSDYEELNWLNYDPTKPDTDGNGVLDKDEDSDGDGLTNIEEANLGTNMIVRDTDHDGLSDYDEARKYGTDPTKPDTDGDGVDDGVEVAIGSDPLVAETSFATKVESTRVADGNSEAVDISVTINSGAEAAGTLTVSPVGRMDNPLVTPQIPGYLNAAYELSADAAFTSATITFTYGSDVGRLGEDFQPRIYYLNETTGLLEELENQVVTEGKVSANVSHFSIYMLLNKVDFDEVWDREIKPPFWEPDEGETTLDIVFVIDCTASMGVYNDPKGLAKTLSKDFVNKLREGKDKAAVVTFWEYVKVNSALTADKRSLISAINSIRYDDLYYTAGNATDGSVGLYAALDILKASEAKYQYIIFLTDGKDGQYKYPYDSLIGTAKANNVAIYSIGLGTGIDETVLRKIARETGGTYYHATATGDTSGELLDLDEVYADIEAGTIDLTTDSNNDGIPDYYAKLMNDGKLRLSNGSLWLAGATGGNSDDWDGDGLKNGEEITVRVTEDGRVYVSMYTDPLLYDTDSDGYSDYEEIKQMGTSPLKFTVSAEGLRWLMNDANFDEATVMKYLDFSIPKNGEDRNFNLLNPFDRGKLDVARKALIDYFSNHTTEKALSRNADSAAELLAIERLTDVIGAASNVIGALKSAQECAATIGTMGYSDPAIKGAITKANNAREASGRALDKLMNAKRQDLAKLNSNKKLSSFLQTGSKFSDCTSALNDLAEDIKDGMEDISDATDEIVAWARATGNAAQIVSITANTTKLVATATKQITTAGKTVKEWPIKIRSGWLRGEKIDAGGNVGQVAGLAFTVVMDTVETVRDVIEVIGTYKQIEANYAEYKKYLDLLRYIEARSPVGYVREAAQKITEVFNEAGDPDWDAFDAKVRAASGEKILVGTLKTLLDVGTDAAGLAFPVIGLGKTVYNVVFALLEVLGVNERNDTIIAARVYHSITDGSRVKLANAVTFTNGYFESSDESKEDLIKYAIQLVQGRVVGLGSVMKYITGGSPAAGVDRGPLGKEQIEAGYQVTIKRVYDVVKEYGLAISDRLPLYVDPNYGYNAR